MGLPDISTGSYQFVQGDGSDEGKKKPRPPSAKMMPPGYFIESGCGLPQKGNCQPIMKPIQQFFEWSFHSDENSLHKFRETLSPYSHGAGASSGLLRRIQAEPSVMKKVRVMLRVLAMNAAEVHHGVDVASSRIEQCHFAEGAGGGDRRAGGGRCTEVHLWALVVTLIRQRPPTLMLIRVPRDYTYNQI